MGAEESTGRSCTIPLFGSTDEPNAKAETPAPAKVEVVVNKEEEERLKKENEEKDSRIADLEKQLAKDTGERERELKEEIERLKQSLKPSSLNMTPEQLHSMDKEHLINEVQLLRDHIAQSQQEKNDVETFAEEERKILAETEDRLKDELSQVTLQKNALQKKLAALSNSQQRLDAKLQAELQGAREELERKGEALDELKQERDQLEADYQERVNNIKGIHETSLARMIKRQSDLQARLAQHESGSQLPPLQENASDVEYSSAPVLPEDEFHRKMAALAAKVDSLHSQGSQQLTQQVENLEADIAASRSRKNPGPSHNDSVKWPSQGMANSSESLI